MTDWLRTTGSILSSIEWAKRAWGGFFTVFVFTLFLLGGNNGSAKLESGVQQATFSVSATVSADYPRMTLKGRALAPSEIEAEPRSGAGTLQGILEKAVFSSAEASDLPAVPKCPTGLEFFDFSTGEEVGTLAKQEGDTNEFIGILNTTSETAVLDGCTLVFYDGQNSRSYYAMDLSDTLSAGGIYLAGNPGVSGVAQTFPNNTLQDGPDGIALYKASASDFPDGTPATAHSGDRRSAVVYQDNDNIFGCFQASVPGCGSKTSSSPETSLEKLKALVRDAGQENASEFNLEPNRPNPFADRTTIRYTLPEEMGVKVAVYDLLGREVRSVSVGMKTAGQHRFTLTTRKLAPGTYFLQLKAGEQVETQAMKLVR